MWQKPSKFEQNRRVSIIASHDSYKLRARRINNIPTLHINIILLYEEYAAVVTRRFDVTHVILCLSRIKFLYIYIGTYHNKVSRSPQLINIGLCLIYFTQTLPWLYLQQHFNELRYLSLVMAVVNLYFVNEKCDYYLFI